jgi:hypothetical protein
MNDGPRVGIVSPQGIASGIGHHILVFLVDHGTGSVHGPIAIALREKGISDLGPVIELACDRDLRASKTDW